VRRLLPLVVLLLAGCAQAAPGARAGAAREVVTFGDSVPAGNACGCTPFPGLYAAAIGAASDNLSRSGYSSADVRGQLATPGAEAAVRAAATVLIMIGANDVAAAFDPAGGSYAALATQVQQNVTAIVTAVRTLSPSASVLVLGYWNVVEDGAVGRADYGDTGVAESVAATADCNGALSRAAAATGVPYLDTTAAFKGTDGESDPTGLLASDGDHPNAAGQQAIATAVRTALAQVASSTPGPRPS
jgi:acyl-CoA thioesterase-1